MIRHVGEPQANAATVGRGIFPLEPSHAMGGVAGKGALSDKETEAPASEGLEAAPLAMWLAALRRDAQARVVADMLDEWECPDDSSWPNDNFREDPDGTYIYDAGRDEVLWLPSGQESPEHSIDVMMFPLHETGLVNDDDSERTFEDELDWMDCGYFNMRDHIIDCEAIREFIAELAEEQPHALERPEAIALAGLAIFCTGADEEVAGVQFEDKARWFEGQFKAGAQSLTPMMAAAAGGHEVALGRLLGLSHEGAVDIGAVDAKGRTAADHAEAAGLPRLAERIRAQALALDQREALELSVAAGPKPHQNRSASPRPRGL